MIELTERENEFIEEHMDLLEQDKIDEFFAQCRGSMAERIRAFMYESLGINTYKDDVDVLSQGMLGGGYATLPETYEVKPTVRKIEKYAFKYASNLKKVIIPDTVESIDADAFYYCNDLEEVILPNNPRYTFVKQHTIEDCRNIKRIFIPDSVKELAPRAFDYPSIDNNGVYMYANWREDPDDQLSIIEAEVPIFRKHFKFIEEGK